MKRFIPLVFIAIMLYSCDSSEKETASEVFTGTTKSLQNLDDISFDCRYEYYENGKLEYNTKVQIHAKHTEDNPLRYLAKIKQYEGSTTTESIAQQTAYDGEFRNITTYNGRDYKSINFADKKVLIVDSANNPQGYIRGNWVANAIDLIFSDSINQVALFDYQDTVYLSGTTELDGEPVYEISMRKYHDQYDIYESEKVYFSKNDFLPRKRVAESVFEGDTSVSVYIIENIKQNPGLNHGDFNETYPEDFEVKQHNTEKEPEPLAIGTAAPDFSLSNADGQMVSLYGNYKGKVVLLDFWGTWCFWCKQAMPKIETVYQKFKNNPDVEIVGISCNEPASAEPAKYMADKGFNYGTLLKGDKVATEYGIAGFPTLFVINKKGEIVHVKVGYDENMDKELSEVIETQLQAL